MQRYWRALSRRFSTQVSILTRPEDRVQRPVAVAVQGGGPGFQSSPGPKTGCNAGGFVSRPYSLIRFNPHPARRPGATPNSEQQSTNQNHVSILTRPEDRVQPRQALFRFVGTDLVSILTRPEDRVQRAVLLPTGGIPRCFNPHPARRPGATSIEIHRSDLVMVSILTRPEDRVQLRKREFVVRSLYCFNPHPARRPGATTLFFLMKTALARFNPHPARRPGATRPPALPTFLFFEKFQSSPGPKTGCNECMASTCSRISTRFNPHPARRPGATLGTTETLSLSLRGFNPHPARRPGATARRLRSSASNSLFQSSPGPKTGCNNCSVSGSTPCRICFNPHPARRPGATWYRRETQVPGNRFQSSPGPKTGCNGPQFLPLLDSIKVSILTRPEDRVQPENQSAMLAQLRVSILTRPEDRVQLVEHGLLSEKRERFQSSPGPKTGCNALSVVAATRPGACFNPHPARRPGATRQST